jgi:hypothetical protein
MRALLASLNEHARYLAQRSPVDVVRVTDFELVYDEFLMGRSAGKPFDAYVFDLDIPADKVTAREVADYLHRRDDSLIFIFVGWRIPDEQRVDLKRLAAGIFDGNNWPEQVFGPAISNRSVSILEVLIRGKREMDNRHSKRPVAF